MHIQRHLIHTLLILFLCAFQAQSQETINAGVAANYIQTFKEISAVYEARTGVHVEPTFTSSGNLYSQIVNGAPYDIFLSADTLRPERLFREGLTEKPFVYARGRVVLWSAKQDFCAHGSWDAALKTGAAGKIALCNPETAPYGAAAKEAMQAAGIWTAMQAKLVIAQNVAQAFQYSVTHAVDAGFCAYSSVVNNASPKECWLEIPQVQPIVQAAVLIKTKHSAQAAHFAQFLVSPEAEAIRKKYGYE